MNDPMELSFIDARATRGASVDVSNLWARWLRDPSAFDDTLRSALGLNGN